MNLKTDLLVAGLITHKVRGLRDTRFYIIIKRTCIYNAMLFQMDSPPLIDAIIFSVNIYKYKTEINSIEPILGVLGPVWDNQMD